MYLQFNMKILFRTSKLKCIQFCMTHGKESNTLDRKLDTSLSYIIVYIPIKSLLVVAMERSIGSFIYFTSLKGSVISDL